jgi:molybdopterin biosynthesis enzyme MoaB
LVVVDKALVICLPGKPAAVRYLGCRRCDSHCVEVLQEVNQLLKGGTQTAGSG